jgi:ribosomal protein L30/L7E
VRRSAALRTLRRARAALARGGRLFLLVKLTRDRYFQRIKKDPAWTPVPGERNTLRRRRVPETPKHWRGRKRGRRWTLSALTPREIRAALRGLRLRRYSEAVLRSDWDEPQLVTHHLAEVVAEKEKR